MADSQTSSRIKIKTRSSILILVVILIVGCCVIVAINVAPLRSALTGQAYPAYPGAVDPLGALFGHPCLASLASLGRCLGINPAPPTPMPVQVFPVPPYPIPARPSYPVPGPTVIPY